MALDPLPPAAPSSPVPGARPTPREDIPRLPKTAPSAIAPLSLALIAISVVVAIYSNLGNSYRALAPLLITDYRLDLAPLWEVRHGEVWRLITPIFIHFGLVHLIFNMLWVKASAR